MNTTIEKRKHYPCSCGCGRQAHIGAMRIVTDDNERFPILPGCEPSFCRRRAAIRHLNELVRERHPWPKRMVMAPIMFHLQRVGRTPFLLSVRASLIFGSPRWLGLRLGRLWKI
jgi:hypothetical protein